MFQHASVLVGESNLFKDNRLHLFRNFFKLLFHGKCLFFLDLLQIHQSFRRSDHTIILRNQPGKISERRPDLPNDLQKSCQCTKGQQSSGNLNRTPCQSRIISCRKHDIDDGICQIADCIPLLFYLIMDLLIIGEFLFHHLFIGKRLDDHKIFDTFLQKCAYLPSTFLHFLMKMAKSLTVNPISDTYHNPDQQDHKRKSKINPK